MSTFKPTGFSESIFKQRYAFTEEETWEQAALRVATQMASAESGDKFIKYRDIFDDIISKNLFMPGGRIMYGSGRPRPNLLNCYHSGDNLDSKEGWGKLAYDMIVTSCFGGGLGSEFSDVRPSGAIINGQKGLAPGPIPLMDLINGCGEPIRAGNARRVALMMSMLLTHPNSEDFIKHKSKNGKLTFANISVKVTDVENFIKKVKDNGNIELHWKNQYKSEKSAKYLWDLIVENAWKTAEPGVLNWDLVESENTIYYLKKMLGTNPCGEIVLSSYESCCLGSLILSRFVEDGKVNWELMGYVIRNGVRFLDNVHSVNTYPLPEMEKAGRDLRRIGLGVTALADMLILLGYKYGSEDGNKFIDHLFRFISKQAYESSIMLSIEKGPFNGCDNEKHIKSGYVKRMTPKIKQLILEHGIRNCALLTVAPTGTISIVSGNCSSGIEPIMAPAYERRYWEGDQRKVEVVLHPLFKRFMDEGLDTSHFIGANDLSVREHMEVQKIVQNHIDNSISKTINMPENYPIEDMSNVWLEYLPYLKGTTFYRNNSRKFVDSNGIEQEPPIVPYTLEKAVQVYKESKELKEAEIEDTRNCKNGVCEV